MEVSQGRVQSWALELAVLILLAVILHSLLSMILDFELYCICCYVKHSESFLGSVALDAAHKLYCCCLPSASQRDKPFEL